ncbi:ABC-2 family transporter protein [Aquisphaera giovannonii]|uniref:ABC-2 family transporter protein n=1 Tax=Aquisphaera giovannonii TaxID=406548 RepID=A0A5B9VW40_9BACT|nr:hypothetical protein [Aquisphaera giovannonii]QEH32448.1 ABC-2 family transporter protein [Aquisphaera giovannonii]
MVARLWWKDARQLLPIWAIVALVGLLMQGLVVRYLPDMILDGGLLAMALFWASLYACLAAVAAFAGEREFRTMTLLDTLPATRREIWLAKSSFALATAAALALFLFLCAGLAEGGWPWLRRSGFPYSPSTALGTGIFVLVVVVSNGLFWSSWMKNVLLAATMAILTTFLTSPVGVAFAAEYTGASRPGTLPIAASLAVAALLTAGSYLAFLRSGPPARPLVAAPERSRRVRLATAGEAPRADDAGLAAARPAWGRSAALRIAWQAFREVRSVTPWLVLIGVVIPGAYWFFSVGDEGPALWVGNAGLVALLVGLNMFGMETRAGTQRLLAGHGVRPGVVWLVRLIVWLLPLCAVLTLGAALYLWLTAGRHIPWASFAEAPRGMYTTAFLSFLGAYLAPLAVGALSGMVFRRGIMAGAVAVLGSILLAVVVVGPTAGLLVNPRYLIVVPLAILAVGFLWRWDWLLDRPGLGRWARLIALGLGACVLVFAGYVAERAWNIPTLTPEVDSQTFAIKLPAEVPPAENAAELYQESSRALRMRGMTGAVDGQDKKMSSGLLNEDADLLPFVRRATAMTSCRFVEAGRRTPFSGFSGFPDMYNLRMLLADSAKKRRSNGDLKGAWEDILAVFRMARQQSGAVPVFIAESGQQAEGTALWLAWNWAADAGQTADSLQAALDEFQKLPPMPSPADPYRVEALMARNAEQLPRSDYADKVQEFMASPNAKERPSPLKSLYLDVLATPWERSRMSRVSRLYLAAAIQDAVRPVAQSERAARRNFLGRWRALDAWTGEGGGVTAAEMDELLNSSPLAQQMLPISFRYMMKVDSNEASRRALVQILGLRIYQARHDGKLPEALDELVKVGILHALPTDPFTSPSRPFGYLPSAGQRLLPLEDLDFFNPQKESARPTVGDRLLYSVGWDFRDDKAQSNGAWGGIPGDLIFPLADNVRPPK